MEANPDNNLSYLWRIICIAKDIIEQGGRWIISKGDKVKIWKDKWATDHGHLLTKPPGPGLQDDAKVEELIDPATRQWNKDILASLFSSFEVKRILMIPVPFSPLEDKFVWDCEKDGSYSKDLTSPGPSTNCDSPLWKAIWNIPLSNKVRNFVWRIA